MKIILRIAFCFFCISTISTVFAAEKPQTDFAKLMGQTRQQLQPVFPGTSNEITNWNGFSKIYLSFNARKKLNQFSASFSTPVSENEAIKSVREHFGIDVSASKPVRAPAAVRFESVNAAVKTVTLRKAFPKDLIEDITVTYTLGYDE